MINAAMRRKVFQSEGWLSSKTSYAGTFKDCINHTPPVGVDGAYLDKEECRLGVTMKFLYHSVIRVKIGIRWLGNG